MKLFFNIALIVSLIYLPWWLGALVLCVACFAVSNFYEAIIYGIVADALYATSFGFHGFSFVCSLFAFTVFAISVLLKDKLSWQ